MNVLESISPYLLTLIIFAPLAGAAVLCLLPSPRPGTVRVWALTWSVVTLVLCVAAVAAFYQQRDTDGRGCIAEGGQFGLEADVPWLGGEIVEDGAGTPVASTLDVRYHVAVDGISLWLLVLTGLLTPLAVWSSFTGIRQRVREYYVSMLLLETGMLGVFCARDLLLFYVCFEFTLIPLYFLIGIWGGPERRRAANKFFIYTIAGSVLTFAGILYVAYYAYAHSPLRQFTFDFTKLYSLAGSEQAPLLPANVQWWLFVAFAAGFAIKVPLFPVHTWLPLAHTEAPTAGSVILAGVLLKLGTYGFLRVSLPMLPHAVVALAPVVGVLAVIGIIYGALAAWVQEDVKKLVAYSSVSHLGFCMLGMFSLKMAGLTGAVVYMINHGLSTGALFLVVGMIYERYHTRSIHEIGGLARKMPWMAFFLIFFTLSSIGLPGLNGFIGEFLVLLGTFTSATVGDGAPAGPLGKAYAIPAVLGIILGALYMLWMCERVLFGPVKEPAGTPDRSTGLPEDLGGREISILVPLAVACLVIGVWPKPLLKTMQPAIDAQVLAYVHHQVPPVFDIPPSKRPPLKAQHESEPIRDSEADAGPLPGRELAFARNSREVNGWKAVVAPMPNPKQKAKPHGNQP